MKKIKISLLLISLCVFTNILCAETVESTMGFVTDFEDQEEREKWVLNTGVLGPECANKWFWGKLGASSGDNGLFISGDSAQTYFYKSKGTTVVAYREFTFDKGDYELSFDWQAGGLSTDGLYVCWVPKSHDVKLNSNSASSMLPEWVERYSINFDRDSAFLSQRTWNAVLDTITTKGESHYLVFVWNNGVLASYSMGAMIDNLSILEIGRCSRPTNLMANPKGDDMVLSWTASADAYDVRVFNNLTGENVEYNDVKTPYQVISGLSEGMCTFYVRSKCDGIAGAWASVNRFLFYPGVRCIDYLHLTNSNCSHNGQRGVVDFGCQAVDSRHTIHWNPDERDPFTNGKLRTVPEGELASVRLGNWNSGAEFESVEYNYLVDTTNNAAVLVLKYAVLLEAPNHDSIDQPRFNLEITHNGEPLDEFGCGEASFAAGYNTKGWVKFQGISEPGYYKDWTTVAINLREYHGKSLKIKLTTMDCAPGAHFAYAYFTLGCNDGKIKGLSCGGDEKSIFEGPEGFNYRWYLPSNPDSTVSTNRRLELPASDTLTYALDVIQRTNKNCYYTLYASAVGRYPVASAEYNLQLGDCKNKVEFINKSYLKRVNQVTNDSIVTNEPCESFLWDFGDGTVSTEESPIHTFPEEGGTYTVTLYSGIADGKCMDDTTFIITLPRMGLYVDTIHATTCLGESYEFKGEHLWETGCYADTLISVWGCDSISVLDLYVAESYDTLVIDTICSGDVYKLGTKDITETGQYKDKLQTIYGCDSVVNLHLTVLETLDLTLDSVVNNCKDEDYISIPYILHSGGLDDFKLYFNDIEFECEGYLVEDNALLVEMPDILRPDKYNVTIHFGERACGKEHETITLNLLYPREVLVQRWGDVLAVTNEEYNGGYEFVAFQWYKNGAVIEGATSSILYEPEGLDLDAEYSVLLTRRDDNVSLMTCSADLIDFGGSDDNRVIVLTLDKEVLDVDVPQNSKVKIWTANGLLIKEIFINEGQNSINVSGMKGLYILEFIFENNQREIQQVIIG